MTIPHHRPQERPATAAEPGASEPREPGARQPGSVSYDAAARRYGPGTIGARERYDELSMRDHLAHAYARLRASGKYDAARHGIADTEPLTAAARTAYRAWADGQHDMVTWTEGRLGMSHAEYAEAMQRVADGAGPDGASERGAGGPGAILCAHADRNGEGAHWLKAGQTCTKAPGREAGQ